jgi:deazaflavin-dependent oxidoreductase (nitroreductase family)
MYAGSRCCYGGAVSRDPQPLGKRYEEWSRRYHSGPVGRKFYRLPVVLWRLGLGPLVGRVLVLLTVAGRSTGLPRHTPVAPHVAGGETYIWCPYGGRSQWYRNMMANPVVTVQSHRGTQVMRAVSIEDDDEAVEVVAELRRFDVPFLRLYLKGEGIADTPEDIARNRQRLHIRRLVSTPEEGPPALKADLVWFWLVPVAVVVLSVRRRCRR